MFFLKTLEHEMLLHPKYFGADMQAHLSRKLYEDVEGMFDRRYGVIVNVKEVKHVGAGKIVPGKGFASFKVVYVALIYKLFVGEVADAVVTNVNRQLMTAEIGPIQVVIHSSNIPTDFTFDADNKQYVSSQQVIGTNSEIRVRILKYKIQEESITAVATMKEDYLGLVNI